MSVGIRWGVTRDDMGMAETGGARRRVIDAKAVVAEILAMTLFVIVGCGTACANGAATSSDRIIVAMAFGMGILVLAYTIGHHSGGQINCAVTFSLVVGGQVPWYQGIANVLGQLLGSILGAVFLCAMFPCKTDRTGGTLGTNIIAEAFGSGNALAGEIVGTFLLCFVVWETAVSPVASCGKNACIAIGFAVFLAHVLLLPIDGCSINPTRSFGPAVVGSIRNCHNQYGPPFVEPSKMFEDLWVMWLGPLIGGGLAAGCAKVFRPKAAMCQTKVDPVVE
eukprot:TRINITY_DN85207_c0_g1_i1.p1 TRINITY_DN85207_c0_g1~~TRINITY_DN85207_c0_g1_i1.p1  ORF type:complete len:300 (-),score=44.69 TRINITY_DN85207_c0_g1_i1:155-991(-)